MQPSIMAQCLCLSTGLTIAASSAAASTAPGGSASPTECVLSRALQAELLVYSPHGDALLTDSNRTKKIGRPTDLGTGGEESTSEAGLERDRGGIVGPRFSF